MPLQAYTACPKCGAPSEAGSTECARCGVVFAKWARLADALDAPSPRTATPAASSAHANLEDQVLDGPTRAAHAGVLLVLAWLTWGLASTPLGPAVMESFLHLPDLVFHEAGHVLFSPFGRFMTVLGGSLFQVLLPVALAVAMLREHQAFGATVCAWWTGQNLLDVAPYAADARALSLVLLGGKTGAEVEGHDWEYILTSLDLLHLDLTIGLWMHRVGVLVMVAAILTGAAVLARRRTSRADLPVDG